MDKTFNNLLYIYRRFKAATVANLLGLCLAFTAFMVVVMHVRFEYGYDKDIPGREYIFRMENQRDDGYWDANFARPQIEQFAAWSPAVEECGIMNGLAYLSFRFGVSADRVPGSPVYMERLERINKGYADLFGFDFVAGGSDCLGEPGSLVIPESLALKLFGTEDPLGRQLYFSEFGDSGETLSVAGMTFASSGTVKAVYRDFPENTRLQNVVYSPIGADEMMDDWTTGSYYSYVKLSSPDLAGQLAADFVAEHAASLRNRGITDIRLRPLEELYFGPRARWDSTPAGNRLTTDILLAIALLIIVIATINYVNFSVALAPVRIKSITTRKILGSSQASLRKGLTMESVFVSLAAFVLAVLAVVLLRHSGVVASVFGHEPDLAANAGVIAWTALLAVATGFAAGLYPAVYMTSFPPAMALNGSYSLTGRARATRKILVVFQYVISITLIIGSLFIALQNRYVRSAGLGFERDNIVEVRLSFATALAHNELYRTLLLEHPDIAGVAFNEFRFVTDESRPSIGYNYNGVHSYMQWLGVSSDFPEVMGIELLAGRNFRPDDEQHDTDRAVCIINEAAARDIIARLGGSITDVTELVGTRLREDISEVEIIGIARDFHFQSLYNDVSPFGFWVSPRNRYRRFMAENFSYVRIAAGDPGPALKHIEQVTQQLDPGYPADIRFIDESIGALYEGTRKQGRMVTMFSLIAIVLSLVGVFGLVIFEAQRRDREIAVRKVFGASVGEVLVMLNKGFLKIVGVAFLIAVPLAFFGVGKWLENFAYRTPLHLWVFLAVLVAIGLLTAVTVTFQSYLTATENPAAKLRR